MKKELIIVSITKRLEDAVLVQKVLTEHGCSIKTRLGLHDASPTSCSNTGLLILEIINPKDASVMAAKLKKIKGVNVKAVSI
ncbi:MAG: hypothetical protein BWY84_00268 [Candidatus Aerophobetes bacterium ADurb.Bin490]|nr:MAG: hypothetical protein BWY84_00268 [Candidatus Aerophobetes bacterium ADurb.Bin490]HNZ28495.1 hypothetical protein [Candidatus Goldiibacteriota bacterium]HPI02343.1 hypothetical protein [Candidatus Goldiibacteriota bacterium]HPN63747.1 hypothetical protein [Candidatus Goldiibacteriota bacterium]HRQ43004.1 hypothetical protein [Candidatus Goldiibacteriota bacterium]